MKGLSLFNKIGLTINIFFVFLLLAACAVPHISVEYLSFLSFLSLTVPVLVGLNLFFFLYWAFQRKKQMRYSLFILLFGYFTLGTFIKLKFGNNKSLKEDLKVMSYNVRGFDKWGLGGLPNAFNDIKSLIIKEKPDIICFQEVGYNMKKDFLNYPYHYLKKIQGGKKVHLGIFSKYPIIKTETIHFPNSQNNGSYADIVYKEDTLRFYNLHMQGLGVSPGTGVLRSKSSYWLFRRVTKAFKWQQRQAKMIADHKTLSPYKTILCGDFNNTQFSNVYHILKGDMFDTFIEHGAGLGRTFDFLNIPFRIDFIFADEALEVTYHKNYDLKYSDHFPIMASFRLK